VRLDYEFIIAAVLDFSWHLQYSCKQPCCKKKNVIAFSRTITHLVWEIDLREAWKRFLRAANPLSEYAWIRRYAIWPRFEDNEPQDGAPAVARRENSFRHDQRHELCGIMADIHIFSSRGEDNIGPAWRVSRE